MTRPRSFKASTSKRVQSELAAELSGSKREAVEVIYFRTECHSELHAGPNFKIRPDPTRQYSQLTGPDPTRWLSMMGKKGFMHGTMHTVQRLHPGDQQHEKCFHVSDLRYQIHVPSVRMHRDLHEVAALYQLLPESLNCDDWVPTNMYARNVRDVAVELSLMIRPWSCNKKSLC